MKDNIIERVPRPEHFNASKLIVDQPFPAEHPYSSHISRFALFPSFEPRCQPRSSPAGVVHIPDKNNNRRASASRAAPLLTVVSKTKGFGERVERLVQSADPAALNRWHEHNFDQLPKYPGAKRQVYYPTPPKLFAPNQDLDSEYDLGLEERNDMATKQVDQKLVAPTRVIGKDCSKSKQQLSTSSVQANNKYRVEDKQRIQPCMPLNQCRTGTEAGRHGDTTDCSTDHVMGLSNTVTSSHNTERHVHSRKPTASEREEHRLLNGQDYINLPSDKCTTSLHSAYAHKSTPSNVYSGLHVCRDCPGLCPSMAGDPEPDYKKLIREQHDRHQQVEAANRWHLLNLQTPAHDVGALRRKMSLSSVKHGPNVFYDHEGRYQRERAGLYKTSYDPSLLEYAMNAHERSGAEMCDLTGIERGALDYPTELNNNMDEALGRSRAHVGSVPQYNHQPSSYELFRPFEIAKILQKRHLQPFASEADIRTQEGEVIWNQFSTYQGAYNTQKYLQENYPIAEHARKEPLQVMSSVNDQLSHVKAFCGIPKKPVQPFSSSDRCCDQEKTSTGAQRTLAASLVALNCPQPYPAPTLPPPPVDPPGCDWYEPFESADQYDLSVKPLRNANFSNGQHWSDRRGLVGEPTGEDRTALRRTRCPSKAEVLTMFNDVYKATHETAPDLREHTTSGKRHSFAGSMHSQVLRGSAYISLT